MKYNISIRLNQISGGIKMVEIIDKLLNRIDETGEELVELIITEKEQYSIVIDDTDTKSVLEYNTELGVWE